jgi:hypothetical protein
MPDLGKKYECYNCRTKFYNLGKPEAICPKCGANQKDAKSDDYTPPPPRPRRAAVLMEPIPEETTNEFGEEPAEEEDVAEADDFDEEEEEVVEADREEEEEF